MIKLSIIITCYKSNLYIENCIKSIYQFNDLDKNELEILIIDNYQNQDNLRELVDSISKDLRYYINPHNGGYGNGNNLGAREARGEILLFLNPDTILTNCVFKEVIDHFYSNNKISCCGIQILNKNNKKTISFFSTSLNQHIWTPFFDKFCNVINYYNQNIMTFSGACFFIRANIFNSIGQFDENIFMYGEESDLHFRIKLHNKSLIFKYFKYLQITHLENSRYNKENYLRLLKSHIYLINKYGLNLNKFLKIKRYQNYLLLFYYYLLKREKYYFIKDCLEMRINELN